MADDASERHEADEIFLARRHRGDLLFAILMFALSLFLLSQLGSETRWFNRVPLLLQPRFWPAVTLTVLTVFSALYLIGSIRSYRRHHTPGESIAPLAEVVEWLKPAEYAVYFVLYAAAVPLVGYLLATVVFMPLMGRRVGYRKAGPLIGLAVLGLVIVLFFKTGLKVKMPAGALYDWFPDAVRNFLIRHF